MDEQTQNIAISLQWCRDENQKLRQEIYDLKQEKKVLEEQLKQQNEWFQEIIRLVGADPSELAVNAVSDFVRQHQ